MNSNDGLLPESFETYQIVYPSDMVFRFTDLQNDKRSLRSALVREVGTITSAYLAVRLIAHEPRYFSYLMRAYDDQKVFYAMGGGLRQSLKFDDVKHLPVITPPADEQRRIADYLDSQTAKLDLLIGKQERLVEALSERRQAVIGHVVTKGLDPNTPMKDSGIEWIGAVPEGWIVQKLSRHFTARKGASAAMLTQEYAAANPGEHPVYSGQTENGGVMAYIDSFEFDAGEEGVLFSTTVGSAKVMTVQQIFGRFSLSQNCMIIGRKSRLVVRYYFYFLQALFKVEKGKLAAHMQSSFRMSDLYSYRIVMPPFREQEAIAIVLDRETAQIDALSAKAREMIDVLKERRQALISAAVTGKIDVRGLS